MNEICLKATLCTHEEKNGGCDTVCTVTALDEQSGALLTADVFTGDLGIAGVEAFTYWSEQGRRVRLVSVSDERDPEGELRVGALSNELLREHLNDANRCTVACFLSLCESGETDPAEAERRLRALEVRCNTSAHDGTPLISDVRDVSEILRRNGHIWQSWLFAEQTDLPLSAYGALEFCRKSTDPDLLWYYTFLLSLWGHYECYFPAMLYDGVKSRTWEKYRASLPALEALLTVD